MMKSRVHFSSCSSSVSIRPALMTLNLLPIRMAHAPSVSNPPGSCTLSVQSSWFMHPHCPVLLAHAPSMTNPPGSFTFIVQSSWLMHHQMTNPPGSCTFIVQSSWLMDLQCPMSTLALVGPVRPSRSHALHCSLHSTVFRNRAKVFQFSCHDSIHE